MLVLSILPIYMYACAYVCVLHTYRRVKQLTVKIKSNNRAHTTHRHSHSRTHARTLQLTASHAVRLHFSLSLSPSRTPAQWRQLSWIIAAGSFLQFAQKGWGRALQQATTSASTQQVAAQRYARQSSAALLVLAAALAALPFRISHSTSWRSERGSVHRLVRRSQLTFSARWNLVADGRVFVSTVPQFHHSSSASAAFSQQAPQQTLVALRRRRSPLSASRKWSLNYS